MPDQIVQLGFVAGGTVAAAGFALAAYGVFAPRSSLLCPVISRGRAGAPPAVALTFDDGPDPSGTGAILDALAALDAQAAFFVVGVHVERWPDLVRRIDAEGHLVCNHTYSHPNWGGFNRWWQWETQLRRADDAVERVIGKRPVLFRPPLGIKTPHTARALRRTGHRLINWTLRAMDGIPTTPQRILDRLLPHASPGDILALHDGLVAPARRNIPATIEAIAPLVRGLRAKGLEVARLDQLTGLNAYGASLPVPSASPSP